MNKQQSQKYATVVLNGWLETPVKSIQSIINRAAELIYTKRNTEYVHIFHATKAKAYIEEATNNLITLEIVGNTVCTMCKISVNIDYNELSTAELSELRTKANQIYQTTQMP